MWNRLSPRCMASSRSRWSVWDIAALWLLCSSYDNMKVKLPKKTRYGVGITGNWNGKSVQLAPAELWTKKSEAQSLYDKFMKLNGKTVMAEVVEVNPKVEWRHELLNMGYPSGGGYRGTGIPARPNNGGRRPSFRERAYIFTPHLGLLAASSSETSH